MIRAILVIACGFGSIGCLLTVCHVAVLWSEGEL